MKVTHIASALLFTSLFQPVGAAIPPSVTGAYNFSYRLDGERSLLPLQVFDDGKNTYFQFRGQNRFVPAIVAEANGVTYVAAYTNHGPYIVVPGVASSYVLKHNSLSARVEQFGSSKRVTAPEAPEVEPRPIMSGPTIRTTAMPEMRKVAAYGPVEPAVGAPVEERPLSSTLQSNKTLQIPFKVDSGEISKQALELLRNGIRQAGGEVVGATVVARDDNNYKEGVVSARARNIRAALVKLNVPASAIRMREGFPRDSDADGKPTSDVTFHVSPRKSASDVDIEVASVPAAMRLVTAGLHMLVRLGVLADDRATMFRTALSESIVQRDQRSPAVADEQWVMTPADGTAKMGLTRWANKAGYEMDWRANVDFPVATHLTVNGHVLTAIGQVMGFLRTAKVPLGWRVEGNKIVVESLG